MRYPALHNIALAQSIALICYAIQHKSIIATVTMLPQRWLLEGHNLACAKSDKTLLLPLDKRLWCQSFRQ